MASESGELAPAPFQTNWNLDSEVNVEIGTSNGSHLPNKDNVQSFRRSTSVWYQLHKPRWSHSHMIIAACVVAGIIGIALGAGITAATYPHIATKDDAPPPTASTPLQLNTTTAPSCGEKVVTPPTFTEGDCIGVEYERKCFRVVMENRMTVDLDQSKALCEEAGLRLANIYTPSHYYMIEGYLREHFPASNHISAWIGMTMIPKNHQIVLSTGDFITLENIPWFTGYPSHEPEYTHMAIDVRKMPTEDEVDKQGLWNYEPSWYGNAAICEGL